MLNSTYDWEEKKIPNLKEVDLQSLAKEMKCSPLLVELALSRGYQTKEAIENFLKPSEVFHDPFLLYDMEKAVERIRTAILNNEAILIYGDYDADGITATTILVEVLDSLGANVSYYLPDRFEDGYGPNQSVYKYYIEQGIQLIITCDNGVAGHQAIHYAKERGVDVIITDHHEIGETLPEAYAVVHARHPKGHYPFGDLCGVGVALKVATALLGDLPTEYLDVCAIGTIADLVSLTDENRTIVQMGLKLMQNTDRVGLAELIQRVGVDPKNLNEETVAFQLAPRLNALGRLGSAMPGVELLTTFDVEEAKSLVDQIEVSNQTRRSIVDKITQEAFQQVEALDELEDLLIVKKEGWHEGVLGIVASRLVEKYHRPTLVLTKLEDRQVYKGSGRSIEGVNLFRVLQAGKAYAPESGGHAMAGGMTVPVDQFEEWQKALKEAAKEDHDCIQKKSRLTYDSKLSLDQFTEEMIHSLDCLRPFGTDNPVPRFLLKDVQVIEARALGKNQKTLKLKLSEKEGSLGLEAVAFGKGETASYLSKGQVLQVVCEASLNSWQGRVTPQGRVIDFWGEGPLLVDWRHSQNSSQIFSVQEAYYYFEEPTLKERYQGMLPSGALAIGPNDLQQSKAVYRQLVIFDQPKNLEALKHFIKEKRIDSLYLFAYLARPISQMGSIQREEVTLVYRYLRQHQMIDLKGKFPNLAAYLKLPEPKLEVILKIMEEVGFIQRLNTQIHFFTSQNKVDLQTSRYLQAWQNQVKSEKLLQTQTIQTIKSYLYEEE